MGTLFGQFKPAASSPKGNHTRGLRLDSRLGKDRGIHGEDAGGRYPEALPVEPVKRPTSNQQQVSPTGKLRTHAGKRKGTGTGTGLGVGSTS